MQDDIAAATERSQSPIIVALWKAYAYTRDAHSRSELIEHYLEFARMIAARLYKLRANNAVSFDDYLQYARTGLIEAVDRFDPARGVRFESFAGLRIRGAILNGLESETEQAAQQKVHGLSAITERLESLRVGTPARERQSLDGWVNAVVSVAIGVLLESDEEDHPADDNVVANPYASVELLFLRRRLKSSIHLLSPREAKIIELHYFEHQEFQLIAQQMKISKGRVSQLHAQGLAKLQKILKTPSNTTTEL